jgi:uncharacterized membrane protein
MRPRHWFGPFFIGTGTLHFVIPKFYRAIIPEQLAAWRTELVVASGVAEILGGLGVLFPKTRRAASWWSIATLVVVFPANVYMALNPGRYAKTFPGGVLGLWLRLPLQLPVIAWARAAARD